MEHIRSLYEKAVKFKKDNPEIELSVFQICSLEASRASTDQHPGKHKSSPITTETTERVKALLPVFDGPFTATDMAVPLFRVSSPSRYQILIAARILRDELGLTPRKTNGRMVYDPPADDQE